MIKYLLPLLIITPAFATKGPFLCPQSVYCPTNKPADCEFSTPFPVPETTTAWWVNSVTAGTTYTFDGMQIFQVGNAGMNQCLYSFQNTEGVDFYFNDIYTEPHYDPNVQDHWVGTRNSSSYQCNSTNSALCAWDLFEFPPN